MNRYGESEAMNGLFKWIRCCHRWRLFCGFCCLVSGWFCSRIWRQCMFKFMTITRIRRSYHYIGNWNHPYSMRILFSVQNHLNFNNKNNERKRNIKEERERCFSVVCVVVVVYWEVFGSWTYWLNLIQLQFWFHQWALQWYREQQRKTWNEDLIRLNECPILYHIIPIQELHHNKH
jgi:hypothetical protein